MNSILDLQNLIQGFKLSCQTKNKKCCTCRTNIGSEEINRCNGTINSIHLFNIYD